VYRSDVQRLVDSVDAVLADRGPIAGRHWFEMLAEYIRLKHGLGEALHAAAVQYAIDETYAPVVGAVATLLGAWGQDRTFKPGLDPDDILLRGYAWRVEHSAAGRAQARGPMDLAVDGVRRSRA
jgi:hypothetical protein